MACCGGHETSNVWNLFEHTTLVKSNHPQLLEIRRVHLVLQKYLQARADETGETEALAALTSIYVEPQYSFQPIPTKTYQNLLSSITLLYWTATLSILDTEDPAHSHSNKLTSSQGSSVQPGMEKERLVEILRIIPKFGDPTPAFTGDEANDLTGKVLTLKQIESLMRVGGFIFKGITRNDITLMWSELGEAGGALWEDE